MLRLPLLSLLLALTSAAATSKPLDVTVDQLVAMPEQFNGSEFQSPAISILRCIMAATSGLGASDLMIRGGTSTLSSLRVPCRR